METNEKDTQEEDVQEPEKIRSFIHIEFKEVHSTLKEIQLENITPNQIYSIIDELKLIAQSGLAQQAQERIQQQILIPKPKILQ